MAGRPVESTLLREDDRARTVDEYAVVKVPPHGAGEHRSLHVLADTRERGDVVAVVDSLDVLLDDRALVERGGDVMGGRADQLHSAFRRAPVGVGAGERGQERVV